MEQKSIIELIRESGKAYEYNPEKFWEENTIESIFQDLQKASDHRKKSNWNPDYILSIGEAKNQNLYFLKWLCENYRVMGGFAAHQILKQREIIINFKNKFA